MVSLNLPDIQTKTALEQFAGLTINGHGHSNLTD